MMEKVKRKCNDKVARHVKTLNYKQKCIYLFWLNEK